MNASKMLFNAFLGNIHQLNQAICTVQRKKKKRKSRETKDLVLIRDTTPSLALNATLVGATTDAEETLLSPVGVPRVGAEPVVHTTLSTIAEQLDSVATLIATRLVEVDTASIAHEISINLEGNLEGTVGGDLGLHVSLTGDGVDLLALVLVRVPVDGSIIALVGAGRSGGGGGVGEALLSHDTSLLVVLPGARGIATAAGTAAGAGEDIGGGKRSVLAGHSADTVAHGLDSTEGPAGAALPLVTDLAHGGAVGPLSAGIEGVGGIGKLVSSEVLHTGEGGQLQEGDTKEATSLALGHAGDAVGSSPPEVLLGVDLLDHLGAHGDLLLSEGDHGENSNSNNELVHR